MNVADTRACQTDVHCVVDGSTLFIYHVRAFCFHFHARRVQVIGVLPGLDSGSGLSAPGRTLRLE